MSLNVESGTRSNRLEFARQGDLPVGAFPTDPTMEFYSSVVLNSEWGPSSEIQSRRGIGHFDVQGHLKGPESNEYTVEYELERWFTSGGSAADAAYDGLMRDADGLLPSKHTVVERVHKGSIKAKNTLSGSTSRATRLFMVGTGGKIETATIKGDPSDSQPNTVELGYKFERVRPLQIDQPASGTLDVFSTSAADTDISVTLEDESGDTTETLNTDGSDGTTAVTTTASFDDLDVVHVPDDHVGTIVVEDTNGDVICRVLGSDSYNGVESDHGVPAIGSGSHADSGVIGTPELFIGDVITRGANPIAYEFNAAELTVENNVEETERASTYAMELSEGVRDVSLKVTVFGEKEGYAALENHLKVTPEDNVWEMDGGNLTLPSAVLKEPGVPVFQTEEAIATRDNTFESQGIEISEN